MPWHVLGRVYRRPVYIGITLVVSVLTLTAMVVVPSYATLLAIFLSPVVSVISKIGFFFTLYGSLGTNYTVVAAVTVVAISGLFGVNAALLTCYIRRARGTTSLKAAGQATFGGTVAAVFGIGCAACGSAVVLVLLQLLGITWVISYLPLHGAEFGLFGVGLLLYTTYTLARRIDAPLVCPVD